MLSTWRILPGHARRLSAMPRATDRDAKTSKAAAPARQEDRRGGKDVRLTGDRLVVQIPENGERKSASGLPIPATAAPAPKRLAWADVKLVGPDVRVATHGDRVLFLPSSASRWSFDGEELVLLRERDVQAVSTPATDKPERPPAVPLAVQQAQSHPTDIVAAVGIDQHDRLPRAEDDASVLDRDRERRDTNTGKRRSPPCPVAP